MYVLYIGIFWMPLNRKSMVGFGNVQMVETR